MRGLAMDFPDDRRVYSIGDQYLFGPSLMVCPVYNYQARERDVYFPNHGGWYNLYSGEYIAGGQKLNVNAPYERMPLFVRSGSILPVGPEIEYTTQKQADHIKLYVYTGADAQFSLYEDEGTNYNYEKGAFANIPMAYDEASKKLTIGAREGEFEGMLEERQFEVIFITKETVKAFNPSTDSGIVVDYRGSEIEVVM